MKERRKKALDGCFCTHESNSYYPSLPFNPGHLIQIEARKRNEEGAEGNGSIAPEPEGRRSSVRSIRTGSGSDRLGAQLFVMLIVYQRKQFFELSFWPVATALGSDVVVAIADPVLKYESQISNKACRSAFKDSNPLIRHRRRPSLGGGGQSLRECRSFLTVSRMPCASFAPWKSPTPSQRRWSGSTIGC